jgi:hypothetical protein
LDKGGLGRLVTNLTGSGGSGKGFVLDATKSFCKQFCRAIGEPFNISVFIVEATSNTAVVQLKGDTIYSIAGLQRKLSNIFQRNMKHLRFLNRSLLSKVILATLKQMNQNQVHIINLFKVTVAMTTYKVEMVKIS